jgi:hypothetical protein
VVDVDLDDLEPLSVLGGDLVDDRLELLAGAAPYRREIDEHGTGAG